MTYSKRVPQFLASTLAEVGAGECGTNLAYILSSRERVYYREPDRSVYSQFVSASKNVKYLPLDLGLKQRDADVEGSAVVRALAAAAAVATSATF